MDIIVAKNGGFCRGVQKAVDTALTVPPENTYIYGEIIHNPDVVKTITDRGIKTVDNLDDVPTGARLIIRSHGVGEKVYVDCARRDIQIIDCTCEFVKRTQKIIREEYSKGKTIIIVGEPTHPEVIGLNGWCNDTAYVFTSDTDDFSILPNNDCCIVAQTTYSQEKFDKIIKNLNDKRQKTVEIFETICYTTIGRQNEASELAKQCDAVLVIGGLNSSNTNKLYDICSKHCANVFRLGSAADFEYKKIKRFKKVGIVTGASTPNGQTQEVLLKMEMETEAKATMAEVVANMDNQQRFKKGQLITATISSADEKGVEVLLPNTKKEVLLDKDQVDCEVYNKDDFAGKIGEEIELMVVAVTPRVVLSQKQIKQVKEEEAMLADVTSGKDFEVECTGFNKGGLTAQLGSYTVFVPAREIRPGFVKELDKYVGKKLRLRLIELKTERRKEIIASQRVIMEEERAAREAAKAAKEAEFFANIHVDDVVEGKVERATAFGAFVSVNGFDCLAHISDLSWTGAKAVTEVLEIGKKYQFKVLKIDEETKKVSIGYKQLQPQPWDIAAEKYAEGDVIHGKVVRIVPFGAFVEVEKGIDGLVHVSQISHEFLENPTTVLSIGQEIDAKILKLDCAEKKMNLSIKALEPKPENLERKEKPQKEEGEGKEKTRKPRAAKPVDEVTEWSEEGISSVSIADLLNK
ncbi:MAG: 4-hydroxy-3-methylbut-2-enyl diphosphate reductase [Clostridiales bacterium]|nr:4-hydroxy-3-methylbut-2-enyl diphosphate reductase [Clostridiales bacterium]